MNRFDHTDPSSTAQVHDPWMPQEEFDYQRDLGRVVEITPEMRAIDAARVAERERSVSSEAQAWRDRLQLDARVLATVKPRAATAYRQAMPGGEVLDRAARSKAKGDPTPASRYKGPCAGAECTRMLSRTAKGGLCVACLRKKRVADREALGQHVRRQVTCACGVVFVSARGHTTCRSCRSHAHAGDERPKLAARRVAVGEARLTFAVHVAPDEVAEMNLKERSRMDKLDSKTVSLEEIPEAAEPTPKVLGRLGALWIKLMELKPDTAEAVQCRSQAHANNTLSHMRKKAKAMGYQIHDRRVGTVLYLWLSCADGESEKAA